MDENTVLTNIQQLLSDEQKDMTVKNDQKQLSRNEIIKKLNKIYHPDKNTIDIYNEVDTGKTYDFIYVETRKFAFYPGKKMSLQLNTKDDFKNGYGYHNFRIIGDMTGITNIELDCGDTLFDRSKPAIQKQYTPFQILQQTALPALEHHNYKITAECAKIGTKIPVEYDVVKFVNPKQFTLKEYVQQNSNNVVYLEQPEKTQYVIKHYHNAAQEVKAGDNHVLFKLPFSQNVLSIHAYLPSTAKNVSIKFPNNISIDMNKEGDSYWKIYFCKDGVNFSRINNDVLLCYETDGEEHNAYVFAETLNIAVICGGMIGLKFTH